MKRLLILLVALTVVACKSPTAPSKGRIPQHLLTGSSGS